MVTRPSWKHLSRLCKITSHKSNRLTSFGINNNGHLVFDYYHEDYGNNSVSDQLDVYNGKDSVLWVNFSQAFANEIQTTYATWRSGANPLLSYDKIVANFITNHSDKWSISIYNEDAEYKYISMYRNGELKGDQYLYQVRGTGEEHLKYFVKNRLMYCDSKWKAGDFVNKDSNTIILRINSPDVSAEYPDLQPSTLIKYKTFSNMYAGVGYGAKAGVTHSAYVTTKETAEFKRDEGGQNDLDTYIFGANEVSSLEDLSLLYCSDINVSAASKLTKLIVGNEAEGYTNANLKSLSLSNNRLLRELNVCNCTELKTNLDFSLCPDIQRIYAQGSGITGVILPSSGFLKEIKLPKIGNLIITNQHRIEVFECEGYENLTTLNIDNSTMVEKQEDGTTKSTNRFPLQDILLGCNIDNLITVNIKNVEWNVDDEATLDTIVRKLSQKQGFVLEGSVHLPSDVTVSDELKVFIHQHFPKLNVIDKNPLFYVDYYDYKGEFWDTEGVYAGENAKGPDKGDPEDIIMDDQGERHLFVEWNNLPTNVQQNCTVNAKWQTQYAISFYSDDGNTRYTRLWSDINEIPDDPVIYGVFTGELPTDKIYEPTKVSNTPDTLKYKFNGWALTPNSSESLDTLPVITGVTNFYATFIEQYPVRFYNDSILYNEQWIKTGESATRPTTNPTKASTKQYEYRFSQWNGNYTNIQQATNVYAEYTSSERIYTVQFYNESELLYTEENVRYTNTLTPDQLYSYEGLKKKVNGVETADYKCTGWLPQLDSKNSIVKCYAIFRYQSYIADSWQTIIDNANSKTIEELKALYPIGARKKVTFASDSGVPVEAIKIENKDVTIDMEIIAYEHDDLADGTGKAKLTFFCKDLPNIQKNMYGPNGDYTGWQDTLVRDFLNNTLYPLFSDELKSENGIKSVVKQSDDGNGTDSILVETVDKCWLASTTEVGFDELPSIVSGQGSLYNDTFIPYSEGATKSNNSRKKLSPDGVNCGAWLTRTTYLTSTDMYWTVQSPGGSYQQGVYIVCYVAFGFCI